MSWVQIFVEAISGFGHIIVMAFKEFTDHRRGIDLLQRSLELGRLGHAYLFTGDDLELLEGVACSLACTLNCLNPARSGGAAVDCCGTCTQCRKILGAGHPDVHWVRPESRSRVITVEQMRGLMQEIYLKPAESACKVAIVVAADRLNVQAANAFLKTLEEPAPKSVLILLSQEPQCLLETILSRCLRLTFDGGTRALSPSRRQWLEKFSSSAAADPRNLMGRYRLLDVILQELNAVKGTTEEAMSARSPLERYDDVEKTLRDRWEDELSASIESEYRRQRVELLSVVQRWFRDVWLLTLPSRSSGPAEAKSAGSMENLLDFPDLPGSEQVANRISAADALWNLETLESTQRLLHSNVQEALALEVGLLKLRL